MPIKNEIIITCGDKDAASLDSKFVVIDIMKEVSFEEFAKTARNLYLNEMSSREITENVFQRVAYSYNDIEIFTDHNLFFTNLCYLISYFSKETYLINHNVVYYLSKNLSVYQNYIRKKFPELNSKLYVKEISKKEYSPAAKTNYGLTYSGPNKAFSKLVRRILYCINFVESIDKKGRKSVLLQSSKRYSQQAKRYVNLNEKHSNQYIFDWNDKSAHNSISKFKLILSLILYSVCMLMFALKLRYYLSRSSQESDLKKLYKIHENHPSLDMRNIINLSILLTVCFQLDKKMCDGDKLIFFGTMDIISRTFDQYYNGKNQRIFIKQNIQGATVEPAFVVFDRVFVGDLVTKEIFAYFGVSVTLREDLCVSSYVINRIKKSSSHQKNKIILYIDESLPRDTTEYSSRLEVINNLNNLVMEIAKKPILKFRLHPTVQEHHFPLIEANHEISRLSIEADLEIADIVVGRQSTALFLPILAGKKTLIIDPSNSSFFSLSKNFYNINAAEWFTDIDYFKSSLKRHLTAIR